MNVEHPQGHRHGISVIGFLLFSWLCLGCVGFPGGGGGRPSGGGNGGEGPPRASDLVRVDLDGQKIGGPRSAYVFAPDKKGPLPLILAFHGGLKGDGMDMAARIQDARNQGVILAFPNGMRTGEIERGWTGPDQPAAGGDTQRDVNFVRALIDELDARYGVDRKKIYAAGFSNGGYMTDWLWCQASSDIQAFFVVSRAMPVLMAENCPVRPARPMALMVGTADESLRNPREMTFPDTQKYVADRLACEGKPTTETLPDKNDRTTVTHKRWNQCAGGSVFEYWEIEGGGHTWPGHGKPAPDKSRDVNATVEMLRFFRENGGL